MKKTLLIGNDINQVSNNYDWDQLIKNLLKFTGTTNLISYDNNKPFPLLYEEIFVEAMNFKNINESSIKKFISSDISNLSANRRGKYLNFDAEISNQGLAVAENVKLVITAKDKEIKTFKLGNVSYGEGKIMTIEFLKLPLLTDTDLLKFDVDTTSEELSRNNNEIIMRVVDTS